MARTKVCPYISPTGQTCPNLAPCEQHQRPRNASWSTDRDRQQQHIFRLAVLHRDSYACTRCGHRDLSGRTLEAHHLKPGMNPDNGVTLCKPCHKETDRHAR